MKADMAVEAVTADPSPGSVATWTTGLGDAAQSIGVRARAGLPCGDPMGVMDGLRAAVRLEVAPVGLEDAGRGAGSPAAP